MATTFTTKFSLDEIERYKTFFKEAGASFSVPQYMVFQARGKGYTASFYLSGKAVIQGVETDNIASKLFSVQTTLNLEPSKTASQGQIAPYPHIGIDESGKGDFFGPLCIAGVLLDEKSAETLEKSGVTDSKKLDDKKILALENLIKEVSTFDIIAISPLKYNELYSKFQNLNKLLAWGHSTVLENILSKKSCAIAISDKFADEKVILRALKEKGKAIRVIQQTKAESDTAVAAASVLARAEFVKRISRLASQYEMTLPKGAGNLVLETGVKFAQKFGKEELKHVSKTHFKTHQNVLSVL